MNVLDPIIARELSVIQRIILDETWLEAEGRGCLVLSGDRIVSDNVCAVILRIGAVMREDALHEMAVAARQLTQAQCSPEIFAGPTPGLIVRVTRVRAGASES